MPGRDRTGPLGAGPGSGWGRGGCLSAGCGWIGRGGRRFSPMSERMAALEEKVNLLLERLKED